MSEVALHLDAKIPNGPLEEKWDRYRANLKLVSPNNKRKLRVIVVGTGLAGASAAAASLAELGYKVEAFTFHDSPRRAHSIAAQGGINAAKNYQNDGDSVWRLFYDTIKGGDFRSREANVYRLAQVSNASSTNVWRKVFRLRENMAANSPTARSAEPRFHGRFTAVVKPDSSCSSGRTRH